MNVNEYRIWLIKEILRVQTKNQFTQNMLKKKAIKSLEKIYDNVE